MNPKIRDVRAAFRGVRSSAAVCRIDRRGVVLPRGGHFQGVQLLPGNDDRFVLSSSSDEEAYLLPGNIRLGGDCDGRAGAPVTLARRPLKHAGGCQVWGDVLAVGVEDDADQDRSEVHFWDLRARSSPRQLRALTIERSGPRQRSTAGAVGISVVGEQLVLAVGTWNCDSIDFYTAPVDALATESGAFVFWRTWLRREADRSKWAVDSNFGRYQTLNLVTQSDDRLFMIGFHRDNGRDWMDLYEVDLRPGAPASRLLRKVDNKHMTCRDRANFHHAAGIRILDERRFTVYAAKGTSGHHARGTTIILNRFATD